MITIGLVGQGVTRRLHAPVLAEFANVRVIDIRLRAELGRQGFTADCASALAHCDMVVIGTPPGLHVESCRAAMEASVPVLCEKPLGLSEEDASSVLGLSQQFKCDVAVNYQLRFLPILHDVVSALGQPVSQLNIIYRSGARKDVTHVPAWYRDGRLGGGVVYSVLPHLVDFVHWSGYAIQTITLVTTTRGVESKNGALDGCVIRAWAMLREAPAVRPTQLIVEIDTSSDYAQFVVSAHCGTSAVEVDIIGQRLWEGSIDELSQQRMQYGVERLQSSQASPWREAQHRYYLKVLSEGRPATFICKESATVRDAVVVHQVLAAIRSRIDIEK